MNAQTSVLRLWPRFALYIGILVVCIVPQSVVDIHYQWAQWEALADLTDRHNGSQSYDAAVNISTPSHNIFTPSHNISTPSHNIFEHLWQIFQCLRWMHGFLNAVVYGWTYAWFLRQVPCCRSVSSSEPTNFSWRASSDRSHSEASTWSKPRTGMQLTEVRQKSNRLMPYET